MSELRDLGDIALGRRGLTVVHPRTHDARSEDCPDRSHQQESEDTRELLDPARGALNRDDSFDVSLPQGDERVAQEQVPDRHHDELRH